MRLWKISGMKCSRFHSTRIDGSPIAPAEWPLARSVALGIHVPDEEVDVEFPDGSRRTIRMSAAPVRSHTVGAPIIGAVAITVDITNERRQRDEKLQV